MKATLIHSTGYFNKGQEVDVILKGHAVSLVKITGGVERTVTNKYLMFDEKI